MTTQSISAGRFARLTIDIAKARLADAQRDFAIAVREIVYECAERDGAGPSSDGWTLNIDTYTWTKQASSSTSESA